MFLITVLFLPSIRSFHCVRQTYSKHRLIFTPFKNCFQENHFRLQSMLVPFPSSTPNLKSISETLRIVSLIRSFRDRGHYVAKLDPLGRSNERTFEVGEFLNEPETSHAPDLFRLLKNYPHVLDLSAVNLDGIDPDQRYFLGSELKLSNAKQLFWSVREIIKHLKECYCESVSAEFSHLQTKEQKAWIQQRMEKQSFQKQFSPPRQSQMLYHLLYAEHFEKFLATKFSSSKRFGLEGCESLICGLHALIEQSSKMNISVIELGMAHRGRLNVLHSILKKPLGNIITEFKHECGTKILHVGDVKYHLGTSSNLKFGEHEIKVSLSPNPSHLEAVNSVVVGKVRAHQFFSNDVSRKKTMGLLLHGDAAFCGLGLAAEALQLSDLPEYTTGGTIHVIINNQIGFTTDPKYSRSSPHPSDVAKIVGAPIFHVNADDVENVVHVFQSAIKFRQEFGKDVVINLVCYRRHGHNEQDDPMVTQPLTYKKISHHPTTFQLYSKQLLEENVISKQELDEWCSKVNQFFEFEFKNADSFAPTPFDWLATNWQGQALGSLSKQRGILETGVHEQTLMRVGKALTTAPESFNLHPYVKTFLKTRKEKMEKKEKIDWALAEALAFGSILLYPDPSLGQTPEKNPSYPVRLSGQDCERGTFNQRHCVLFDQNTAQRYVSLSNICSILSNEHSKHSEQNQQNKRNEWRKQSEFMVCNSNLSESAILGFEYGFSHSNENSLVIWEAQFGDFANNAQVIIDNFVVCGEEKWSTPSNLVISVPHGYDGQGPDHSSARLERFLQLCNDDPDHLPGFGPQHKAEMKAGYSAADVDSKGYLTKSNLLTFMESKLGLGSDDVKLLATEMQLGQSEKIFFKDWELFMAQWMRRNAEKDHNLFVVNVSTPANYFHVLRRQVSRPYAKPLVIMSPKFLLHHHACTSPLSEMTSGTFFRRVICDGSPGDNLRHFLANNLASPENIRRLILCSGKIYYLLAHARRSQKVHDVVLVRIEQIAPLAMDRIASIVNKHPNAHIYWVQEEPKNMGAWSYVKPRLDTMLRELCNSRTGELCTVTYVGRDPSASTATGSVDIHQREMKDILHLAFA